MKRIFLLIIFIFFKIQGQELGVINTDRPDQSEGTYILPKKILQIEEGLIFNKENITNDLMFRYGILQHTELRLETLFSKYKHIIELDGVVLSAKQRITNGKELLPAITLVGYANYSIYPERKLSVEIVSSFEYELINKLSFVGNFGLINQFNTYLITSELNYTPINSLNLFVEYFANFSKEANPDHNIDIGVMYLLTDTWQIDICLGHSIYNSENKFFLSTGFSHQF
ncbi:transporter [Capnocytophaga catalasegens]|uniref:Transporter n=1 Tax=Capnocytophaga catalasegens TaxID=1004260 RepID=A0AAV5AWQ6_9FLAO|nr:transporter [Capnocytophaga catalasegens]GIZ14059.1 hypothetical protein RCZ03_00600 [Capnocytophaga catalasegens]GJM49057.1 hypothetical protein RCZ15_00330 [Capnocytophaga catalasegens]GJM52318.1 hypothetical protein RCZ16_06360 [Capnocytophaga catalasegens]